MKKAQIAVFVVIGILIIAGAALMIYLTTGTPITPKFSPVQSKVLECMQTAVNDGANVLGEQAGYIEVPEFEAGNEYSPFTNQFIWFGSKMPYWFYKTSNGFYNEQIPTISSMNSQLGRYLDENLAACDLSNFEDENYQISKEKSPVSKVSIRENEIIVETQWPLTISLEDSTQIISTHKTKIKNNLGRMYNTARKIYDYEKKALIFENYTVDILSLYAPGTDVELSCAPKLWSRQKVESDLKEALKVNIQSIKFEGDYFKLNSELNKYFVTNLGEKIKGSVNVVYDSNFPTKIEVDPSSGDVMRADPVGIQEGLGILGFCYVPYHFVYSVQYPVVVQVFDENYNLFQFPLVVEVKNNQVRGAELGEEVDQIQNELCQYKVESINVETYTKNGNRLNTNISYKCHTTTCRMGETENGVLETEFPQCVNGFVRAEADGYAPASLQLSTNEPASASLVLSKEYKLTPKILLDNKPLEKDESALISLVSSDYSSSIYLPEQNELELIEGIYNVSVFIFKNGNITLEKETNEVCVDAPVDGLLGGLGFEKEECYTIEVPKQELSQITFAGGNQILEADESSLAASSELTVFLSSNPIPNNLDELQDIYSIISQTEITSELR